ncbi:winged helix-turn-helix transcriptional regulator [Palleronia aestuarii]|uniref:winged helix-turn-helix transcriptional regulator n=1 Tax=Palleronia aestuarii TaxID=568105 RepID=UPI001F32F173|nr:helix-turn-helix domain-containing protein [Palleronia aestuarii]
MDTALTDDREFEDICSAAPLFAALAGRWKTQLIYVLGIRGPQRFGALRRIMPRISPKILTQRLRELEGDRLIWREQSPTIPPQVTYGLTRTGMRVHEVLTALEPIARDWGMEGPAGTEE